MKEDLLKQLLESVLGKSKSARGGEEAVFTCPSCNHHKKKLTKKELLEYAGKKGRTPTHIRVQKESDWKTYYGSHHLIKEYVKGGFEHELNREILDIAFDKKHLTYLECKHQFALSVLEKSEYLNDNILGKFFDKDFA